MTAAATPTKLNINVGILGHVDCGKTSLARALSTHYSTASLDKSSQSRERGITLDLGFSSFTTPLPEQFVGQVPPEIQELQFTLVDCPGHATLIRTIIGGAQIIDVMMLVIDINKGIQTQTAECLVLGEILTRANQMIVVLNKLDLFRRDNPGDAFETKLAKRMKALKKTFKKTKFGKRVPFVQIVANRGGQHEPGSDRAYDTDTSAVGARSDVQPLVDKLLEILELPDRAEAMNRPFLAAVDHCFGIKGQGTVLTGTVLQGNVSLGQTIEIPDFQEQRKVKSMQMFSRPVSAAYPGDRVAIAVTQFQAKKFERGLICRPRTVPTISCVVARVDTIRFYQEPIRSGDKFHITIGHKTVLAKIHCFRKVTEDEITDHISTEGVTAVSKRRQQNEEAKARDDETEDTEADDATEEKKQLEVEVESAIEWSEPFDMGIDYLYLDELDRDKHRRIEQYVVLEFVKRVCAASDSLLIGARFDSADVYADRCRLAFCGRAVATIDTHNDPNLISQLRVYKPKMRKGIVDRVVDGYTVIGKGLFGRNTNVKAFVGLQVQLSNGQVGEITGHFGDSGKFYARFRAGLRASNAKKWKPKIYLRSRKFVFGKDKTMVQ